MNRCFSALKSLNVNMIRDMVVFSMSMIPCTAGSEAYAEKPEWLCCAWSGLRAKQSQMRRATGFNRQTDMKRVSFIPAVYAYADLAA